MKEVTRHHSTRTRQVRKKKTPPVLIGYWQGEQQAKRGCLVCKEAVHSSVPEDDTILNRSRLCRDELWRYL